jgi:hypothetical protein
METALMKEEKMLPSRYRDCGDEGRKLLPSIALLTEFE